MIFGEHLMCIHTHNVEVSQLYSKVCFLDSSSITFLITFDLLQNALTGYGSYAL